MSENSTATQDRDLKAFEILAREHQRRFLAYASSLTKNMTQAEDLVQDAFLVAYRKLEDFDQNRSFAAWMRGIIRFEYLKQLRKNREFPMANEDLALLDKSHALWDEKEAEPGESLKALACCMKKLPDVFKRSVDMFYMKSKSGSEVASEMGCEESTVRKRLQRARRRLGDCVTETLDYLNSERGLVFQSESNVTWETAPEFVFDENENVKVRDTLS